MESYYTIQKDSTGEYEEKKSRFIAYIAHVETEDEAVAYLEQIKAAHPMARHHVYAYILQKGNRARYSDDGEPQKTAGIPVLTVLQYANLKDVICVVVRYFGGTLLGTGGLVRAYTKAPQEALCAAEISAFARCVDIIATVQYPMYETLLYVLETNKIAIIDTEFAQDVTITMRVLEHRSDEVQKLITQTTQGTSDILVDDPKISCLTGIDLSENE